MLGQLSERLTYDRLYREALGDPELRRTKEELEAALSNASEARKVVFELFQDLDGFSLDDYKPFADVKPGLNRILEFLRRALEASGKRLDAGPDGTFAVLRESGEVECRLTLDRDAAREKPGLDLLGLDHPLVSAAIQTWQALPPEQFGLSVSAAEGPGALTWWAIETRGPSGEHRASVLQVGVSLDGKRDARLERVGVAAFGSPTTEPQLTFEQRRSLLREKIEPMLGRELQHRQLVPEGGSYAAKLIGWVEAG